MISLRFIESDVGTTKVAAHLTSEGVRSRPFRCFLFYGRRGAERRFWRVSQNRCGLKKGGGWTSFGGAHVTSSSKSKRNQKGQTTLELAMLLPAIAFLLMMTLKGFHAHHDASDSAIQQHAKTLLAFDHGKNFQPVIINGVEVTPGTFDRVIPSSGSYPGGSPWAAAAGGLALNIGLNQLFAHLPFLNNGSIYAGYSRAFISSAATQWAASGFNGSKISWDDANRAGIVGGLKSQQMTKYLQGANANSVSKFDAQEFFGSGAQAGAIAAVQSKDASQFIWGSMSGMMYSDSANVWFKEGNEILKGATRGALAGSIAGLSTGHFDLGQVATQAALGAFYTEKVARLIPGAGTTDALNSATFGAVNGVVSVLVAQKGKTDGKGILIALASGAFFSGQAQKAVSGNSSGVSEFARTALADAAFAGAMVAVGGDSEAVGRSIYASAISAGSSAVGKEINRVIYRAKGSKDIIDSLPETSEEDDVNQTITELGEAPLG